MAETIGGVAVAIDTAPYPYERGCTPPRCIVHDDYRGDVREPHCRDYRLMDRIERQLKHAKLAAKRRRESGS